MRVRRAVGAFESQGFLSDFEAAFEQLGAPVTALPAAWLPSDGPAQQLGAPVQLLVHEALAVANDATHR